MIPATTPSEHCEGFVHEEGVTEINEALLNPQSTREERGTRLLEILNKHRASLRATQEAVNNDRVFLQIQFVTKLRHQRWQMAERLMGSAAYLALMDFAGNEEKQNEVQECLDDISSLVHSTRYARDAYFDCVASAAKTVENERGSVEAESHVQLFHDLSFKYMERMCAVQRDLEDAVKNYGRDTEASGFPRSRSDP